MKNIELQPCEEVTPVVEMLVNHMIDFGYGYNMQDEVVDSIAEFCDDNGIPYVITEEEDI